jgi:5,5'-dehydrodivanillate O-demethylase oxygenase subunit
MTHDQNKLLTQVSSGTPMGELLRRYWMPIAGVSEFDTRTTKPIRLLGEDLVLYRDLSGTFGLVDRRCAHRRADLAHGMVEKCGLRCHYHGWAYDQTGQCTEQPFEDTVFPDRRIEIKVAIKAYPVQLKAGMIWAYLGPQPAPLLPDWEPFSWTNGFVQIVTAEVPCNWFQAQENSLDPVHFEWMHENWAQRLRDPMRLDPVPRHLKLGFEEFEHGFVYKRVKENSTEQDSMWTVGRVCLWPNGFFLGEHFEWRVPIDDEHTFSITWKFTHVPKEREPFTQDSIPCWDGPLKDKDGAWITSHVMNQDFLAWVGQGAIADRTLERLGASDRGIVMLRHRFFEELKALAAGKELKSTFRDPQKNIQVELPLADRAGVLYGHTTAEIMAHPLLKLMFTSYIFQAGQPEAVRQAFARAMGFEAQEFSGLEALRAGQKNL